VLLHVWIVHSMGFAGAGSGFGAGAVGVTVTVTVGAGAGAGAGAGLAQAGIRHNKKTSNNANVKTIFTEVLIFILLPL